MKFIIYNKVVAIKTTTGYNKPRGDYENRL